MARHLDRGTLLDIVEGRRPAASVPHLAACDRCVADLEQTQQAWRMAADVAVPEPSPLFWEHLSARIREAVAAEELAPTATWTNRWTSQWRLAVAGVAGMALVAALTLTRRTEPRSSVAPAPPAAVPQETANGDAEVDAPLALLADLTGDLDWDAAAEAGITVRTGEIDAALVELSDQERLELQRLLNEALRRSGA